MSWDDWIAMYGIACAYGLILAVLYLLARPPRTWFCRHEPGPWEQGLTEEYRCCTKCNLLLEEKR